MVETPTAPPTVRPELAGADALRVLVVDDDPDINRLLRVRLRARGYAVETAASGDEAMARWGEIAPDLVLLDVSMPGASGLEVLAWVRERGYDAAVVMTTAFGSESVAIEALRQGADDYLRKPFAPEEFRATVDRTVARLLLARQNAELRRRLDEERRRLEAELARAAAVQASLLPDRTPALPGWDLAGTCRPARAVGGDFYDWRPAPDGCLTVTVADVMGKGMPAALLMATVRAALRTVPPGQAPAAAVAAVAAALDEDLERAGSFVTLVQARLEPDGGEVRYVDAGHGHAFVRRADGSAEGLPMRGQPLGLFAGAPQTEGTLRLEPGDALLLVSDGLTDARPDRPLGRDELAAHLDGAADAEQMVDRLARLAVGADGADELADDLTLVVLRRLPARAGPAAP